jgi:DNA-binding NarL/FixJ family response regulator
LITVKTEAANSPMPPSQTIRILAIDDHPLFRQGIAALVAQDAAMILVDQACTGAEAIAKFRATVPDVTLIDLQLPDMDGIDVLLAIRQEFPDARFIVLTTYGGDIRVQRSMRAGARAYMLKDLPPDEMLQTIWDVHRGQKRVQDEVARDLAAHATDPPLTERESQVLELLADGKSNREISVSLSIHEETAKGHVKNLLAKLRSRDRTQAVLSAIKRGFIDP